MVVAALPPVWLPRFAAVLLVLAAAAALPQNIFDLVAISTLLAHYLATFWFHPWRKISAAGALGPHLLLVGLLVAVGLAQAFWQLPNMIVLFGLHFVFTELYDGRESEALLWRVLRASYYAAVYAFFMRENLGIAQFGPYFFTLAMAALALGAIGSRRPKLVAADAIFLVPLFLAIAHPMRFNYILFYHVAAWWVFPLVKGYTRTNPTYLRDITALTLFFVALVFGTYIYRETFYGTWFQVAFIFGYVHVATTFAMSRLNPRFIRSAANGAQELFRRVF